MFYGTKNNELLHWNGFLALEQDVLKLSHFIKFEEASFDTYSIELAHIFLSTALEVDLVLKALCNTLDSKSKHDKITHHQKIVTDKCADLTKEIVYIRRYSLKLEPFKVWTESRPLPLPW